VGTRKLRYANRCGYPVVAAPIPKKMKRFVKRISSPPTEKLRWHLDGSGGSTLRGRNPKGGDEA